MSPEEWDAIQARRALLREQTRLVGPRLPWLSDPALIPDHAVDRSVAPGDVHLASFSLAAWMLIEIVQAADDVYKDLHWGQAMEQFQLTPTLQESVSRAVLSPMARHAPGLFATAEIVAAVPAVASRAAVSRGDWHEIARRSQAVGAALAADSTAVQVLIRSYLSRADEEVDARSVRSLNPGLLKLDRETGLTTVTPLRDLLSAARDAASRHVSDYRLTCVALQAPAPEASGDAAATSMFGAIWSSFAHAANRLVFPSYDPSQHAVPAEADRDDEYAELLDRLAAGRRETLAQAALEPYPPAVERVLESLLAGARGRPQTVSRGSSCPSTAR